LLNPEHVQAEPAESTEDKMEVIDRAIKEGRTTLSEQESKRFLAAYGVPVTNEIAVDKRDALIKAVGEIGFPLVLKGNSPDICHKTERNLIRLDIRTEREALAAFDELMEVLSETKGNILVQKMVKGQRELVVGLTRDPQFGPCVMFGLGGIFTEILSDVSFRVAPLEKRDALEMMQEIKGRKILENIRGMEPADLSQLSRILIQVGQIGMDYDAVKEIDINPLILSSNGQCVAVDALVVLEPNR
jgi:acetate---CoA ligase (ADP-forming) subunit beta